LAEQGKWVARLRDAARLFDQRLTGLEHRMSTLEEHLSDIANSNRKLDVRLTSVTDKLSVLSSKIEVLAGNVSVAQKIGKHPRVSTEKNSK
jgi:septal ring factor EnvC (AmiA/AmiB activator)